MTAFMDTFGLVADGLHLLRRDEPARAVGSSDRGPPFRASRLSGRVEITRPRNRPPPPDYHGGIAPAGGSLTTHRLLMCGWARTSCTAASGGG